MPVTYKKIASVTVGAGGAANIDFQSIPATYTDLVLVASLRSEATTGGSDSLKMEVNASASNFTYRYLRGTGAAADSGNGSTNFFGSMTQDGGSVGWTANTFGSFAFYIPNYAGSTNKSISFDGTTENNATTSYAYLTASLWSQTTAINRLTLKNDSGSDFTNYSTATLYGISKS